MATPWDRLPQNVRELAMRLTPEFKDREDLIGNHRLQGVRQLPTNTSDKRLVQMGIAVARKRHGRTELCRGPRWTDWFNHLDGGRRCDRELRHDVENAIMMAGFVRQWQPAVDAAFATPPLGPNVVPFPPRR